MKKILVANRGEIALRIMRSAREMGISTVAVFSDADRLALHVQYADEALYIGESPSALSYLNIGKIIEACLISGSDAVHPGYGFLSENADFAKALQDAGITLIGPSPEAMEIMGNKLSAKAAALKFDIPLVKGTTEAINNVAEARRHAKEIGFPILIKAAAGGGGKGMRVVTTEEAFEEELKMAISEAKSAFGNDAVFLERYISSPKHIEIQILADKFGNIVHLFERDCSVQRRHQKVIEEAPSSVLMPSLREKMGKCAIDVARSCNYTGAGTVEFIVDEHLDFFFLEMNTRLQVEHPVTEMITGIDLVKEQIKIARGEALSFQQDDIQINGHALELRVYAEDPLNNFLPDIGKLQTYELPQGPGVRVDNAYRAGMEVSVFYDPMIAKLVVWGQTREEALARMIRAIEEYQITGIQSTLVFGKFAFNHPDFRNGTYNTHFINFYDPEKNAIELNHQEAKIAAILAYKVLSDSKQAGTGSDNSSTQASTRSTHWKINRI